MPYSRWDGVHFGSLRPFTEGGCDLGWNWGITWLRYLGETILLAELTPASDLTWFPSDIWSVEGEPGATQDDVYVQTSNAKSQGGALYFIFPHPISFPWMVSTRSSWA